MEKSHRKKINESTNFIPMVMKINFDKTRQQDCISNFKNIRVKNADNVILGTLNINSVASKFHDFKLVVSGIIDIPFSLISFFFLHQKPQ